MGVWQEAKKTIAIKQQRYNTTLEQREKYPGVPDFSGAEILDTTRDKYLQKYTHFVSGRDASKATLWAAHTHLRIKGKGPLICDATPRLLITSLKPQSGKSTLQECLNLICHNADGLTIKPTQYGLQYVLSRNHETVLMDEGDVGKIAPGVVAILNAGYTPNGKILNGSGSKATKVPCFGPISISALDKIETDQYSPELEAFFTRTIKIYMEPGPHARWGRTAIEEGHVVNKALAWWIQRAMPAILDPTSETLYPSGLDYRQEQIWDILFRIADAAGGDWPELARDIAANEDIFPDSFLELMSGV